MILGKVQKQNNNGNIKRQKKNNSSLSQATSAVQLPFSHLLQQD